MSSGHDESAAPGEIHITLLGAPAWRRGGLQRPLARRDAALLALLAVEGQVARDRAAAWLWPEAASDDKARLSLRQRVFRLRRECGHPVIEAAQSLNLLPGVRVDLHAQPLPTEGVLLGGMDFGMFEAFDEWLGAARVALGARQADALAGQAAALQERGALAEAILLVERIVATWPATEHAWRRLMQLHWQRADRAAAVAAFERFEQRVCREWGLRPTSETLALLAVIERDDHGRTPTNAALPPALVNPPLLVGRDAALATLQAAWDEGRSSLVLGAGGMGKTRLLEAFTAQRSGVLRTRARPGDAAQPYATLARGLDEALTCFAPPLPTAVQDELARLLPRLGPPPVAPAQAAVLHAAVAQAWAAAMACGLKAVTWDDLHWADVASLELLHAQLADPALAGLRQAFAARPGEAAAIDAALRQWLGDSLRVQPVRLNPWTEDDLRRLLPSLGLPEALRDDAGLAPRLLRQTGGQPFFLLETLKTLVLAERSGAMPAPAPAVGAMIERRVARLDRGPRRLLQLVAVAGLGLPLPLAATVLAREPVDLAQDWAALADAQLVRDDGQAHDLVREAVLASLPLPAVRALHLALACCLARQPGVDPARLASHWQAAEAWGEAAAAWLGAAGAAVRTGRLDAAHRLFDQASAAAQRSGDPAVRVAALAAAQPVRLLREGPASVVDSLQALLPQVEHRALRARLLLLLAEAEMSRMQAQAADAAAAEALALCDAEQAGADDVDGLLLADATLMQGRTLAWTGQPEAGVLMLQAACERAEADGDLRRRLQARGTLADVLVAAGRRVDSVRLQQGTLALAQRLGDRFELAVAASNLAVYAMLIGDAGGAYDAASQALDAFDAMGVAHVNRVMCAGVHALAAAHRGRFDRALAAALPLLDGPEDPVRRNLRNTLSTLALWRGRPDEAAALLPPLDDDAPPSVRLTGLFARLRWCAWTASDDAAERRALAEIGRAHPAMRDDAHYYRAWAAYDEPDEALRRLDAMAAREAAAGAYAQARSLSLVAVQVALESDADAAARRAAVLWPEFGRGLHPALLPSAAAWSLAQALLMGGQADEAGQARAWARRWIEAARLPDEGPAARLAFIQGVPAHRALYAAASD